MQNVPSVSAKQPQPSKPPVLDPKVELERKLARVRVLREKLLLNRGEVHGKPDKEYVWVNTHETRRTYFEGMGWKLCIDPDVKTQYKREDGTHVRGDLILYEISKEDREVINLDSELRAVEALQGSKEEFLDFAATNKVPAQLQEV